MREINQKMRDLFKKIKEIEPPIHLERAIFRRIEKMSRKKIRLNLIFSYAGSAISLLAFFGAVVIFGHSIWQSEFWSMASLFFSDWQTVATNFYDFVYSLLETFPITALAIILIPIFTFFLSVSAYFNVHNKRKFI